MDQSQELHGTIERFVYQNDENGFAVLILQVKNKQTITVKGMLPGIHEGQSVTLTGSWVTHPKFGKQFDATGFTAHVPTSKEGLKKYLASGMIKGIGPVYAEKLVDAFGTEVLTVIDEEPERLQHVSGIGAKRIEKIISGWHEQKEISQVMLFLQDKGVSTAYATKIYKTYGQDARAIVTENPYRLAEDIWGVGFKTADKIAQNLGIRPDSLQRVSSGILHTISNQLSNGHLYAELDALKKETTALLELEEEVAQSSIKNALHELYNSNKIKLISKDELHWVTLTKYYYCERGIAQKIQALFKIPTTFNFDLKYWHDQLRIPSKNEFMLNEEQQKGILGCLHNKITVITGGPGTGKTTLIKQLLSILDTEKKQYRLAAPTGRAAKRMTEGTGRHAVTLHRLLEFDFTGGGFQRNEENALKLDFLIVDEASMIDVFLAYAILKALPSHAHIVFIGDVDQLPSVGAGNILHDLINSNQVHCVRLKTIFRQSQNSLIIVNAHRINNGEFPVSSLPDAKKDFIFLKEDNPEMVRQHLAWLYTKKFPPMHISKENSMVLVPMNRGIVGTFQINHALQEILNGTNEEKQLAHGMYTYKVHDRVMQIRNNYDKEVFNGDIGTITDINISDKLLHVRFDEQDITYESNELDELVLAYSISIHKSQGSEYDAVIIPLFMQHFTLLQRNLVYTAVTRAKKLCIIIGQTKALAMAIKNTKGTKRNTFLLDYLTSDLQCR